MPKQLSEIPYSIRIHNDDTLRLINELAKKLDNRNAVLNEALDIGVPILYERVFGKDVTAAKEKRNNSPDSARELKELRRVVDDVFTQMVSVETMIAGLFNAKAVELDGDEVHSEELLDGRMCDIPEFVNGMKSDILRQRSDD